MYVVVEPDEVWVGAVEQALAPAVPLIAHVTAADGAFAPVGPVTVAVNTAVPPTLGSPTPEAL